MDCEEVSERVCKGAVGRIEGWIVKRLLRGWVKGLLEEWKGGL